MTSQQRSRSRRIEGLKICMECGEVVPVETVFKHNKEHPKKAGIMYKQLMESDLK